MTSLRFRPHHSSKWVVLLIGALVTSAADLSSAQSVTRAESLKIAESFIEHRWHASAKNVRHGKDSDGVEVRTPDRDGGRCEPLNECWVPGAENIGVAYKWGGNDTPKSFSAGILAGKPGGDVYTDEKRRRGDKMVSSEAVGIDCSGFINRCWKLTTRHSTNSLPSICRKLSSTAELEAGDIMNRENVHVYLFVKWLDAKKEKALFYEASPFSKTVASEHDVRGMAAGGYRPLRYRHIKD